MISIPTASKASSLHAPVIEVFSSIQGEGLFVGEPQTFLRLAGCPLRCAWCDTPGSWGLPGEEAQARIGLGGLKRREKAYCTPFVAATWISAAEEGVPRTLSVTGGEPLLWPEFILALKGFVGERRLHLETAGAHPGALESVLQVVDHVSLDLKLPADMAAPEELPGAHPGELAPRDEKEWGAARRRCLELLKQHDACAKLVISGDRDERDFAPLIDDLARLAPDLPLIIQPVTAMHGVSPAPQDLLDSLVERALQRSLTVRVLPQVHRLLRLP